MAEEEEAHEREENCGRDSVEPQTSIPLLTHKYPPGDCSTDPADPSTWPHMWGLSLLEGFQVELNSESPVTIAIPAFFQHQWVQCHLTGLKNADGVPPLLIRAPEQPF